MLWSIEQTNIIYTKKQQQKTNIHYKITWFTLLKK